MVHLLLNHGGGSLVKKSKLFNWNCIKGNCGNCGVERKLDISKFPILSKCETEINVLEWVQEKRTGTKKADKIPN